MLPLWLSWWRIHLHCGRPGLEPWVGKIAWRRERLPTPVFWPRGFHELNSPRGPKELVLNTHWKDWCRSWNSNTLVTWYEEPTHWKRPWCWERLRAGGEGDDRGWGGWMASPTQWTWVWVNCGSWWWMGRPGVLQFMGSQSQTQLSNWTELSPVSLSQFISFVVQTYSSSLTTQKPCSLHRFTSLEDLSLWPCSPFLSSPWEPQWPAGCCIVSLSVLSLHVLPGCALGH